MKQMKRPRFSRMATIANFKDLPNRKKQKYAEEPMNFQENKFRRNATMIGRKVQSERRLSLKMVGVRNNEQQPKKSLIMSTKEYLRSINATTRQSNLRIEGHKKELNRIKILESKKLPMPSNS